MTWPKSRWALAWREKDLAFTSPLRLQQREGGLGIAGTTLTLAEPRLNLGGGPKISGPCLKIAYETLNSGAAPVKRTFMPTY